MRLRSRWGTHIPVLIRLMQVASGPVLELGSGYFSTPFLHWACFDRCMRLVTYDNNPQYVSMLKWFNNDLHQINLIEDWDTIDLSESWGAALVDHAPGPRRYKEVARLQHVPFVVLHDTSGRGWRENGYHKVNGLFRYRWTYDKVHPATTVVSNSVDLREVFGP